MPRLGVRRHRSAASSTAAVVNSPEFTSDAVVRDGASVIVVGVDASPSAGRDHDRDRQVVACARTRSRADRAGHAHHRAGAVLAEHEVGDPDRHRLAVNGLMAVRPVSKPSFSTSPVIRAVRSCAWKRLQPCARTPRRIAGRPRELLDERVLGREQDEVRAVDRVDARREDLDRVAVDRSRGSPALASGNLTRAPSDRPIQFRCIVSTFSGHSVRRRSAAVEQLVGVVRDAEEPLLELARRDRRAAAPAAAVDDLLVGEHGLAARAPVDVRPLAVREAALEHLQEQPLVPVVVVGQAGGDLALPRVADAEALQLPLHVGDVLERPRLGVDVVLDRGVLGRQAERVPAERVQDVEAAHPLHAGDDVADHVVADVPDVRVPGRVREHLEAVELRLRGSSVTSNARAPPALLPLLLDCLGFVVGHDPLIISRPRAARGRRRAASARSGRRSEPRVQ